MLMSVRDMDVLRLLCWCQNVRPDDLSSISTETERENLITLGLIKRHQRSDTLLLTNSGRAFLQAALEGDVPNLTLSYKDTGYAVIYKVTESVLTELFGHPPSLYLPPCTQYLTKKGAVVDAPLIQVDRKDRGSPRK